VVKHGGPAKFVDALINGKVKKDELNSGDNYVSHNKFMSVFTFNDIHGNEKEWLIEGWKGNYANLGVGGEIGTYYATPSNNSKKHYFTVDKGKDGKSGDMQTIGFELHHDLSKPTLLFGLGPKKHWWLAGFRKVSKRVDKKNLRMEAVISFRDSRMTDKFKQNFRIDDEHGTGTTVRSYGKDNIKIFGNTAVITGWK
jgi:hypothetical protein